jgi:hypothetical protein
MPQLDLSALDDDFLFDDANTNSDGQEDANDVDDYQESPTNSREVPENNEDSKSSNGVQQKDEDTEQSSEEDQEPEYLVDKFAKQLGFDDLIEKYDDSDEGLLELVREGSKRFAEKEIEQTLASSQEAKLLFDYLRNGGDIAEYMNDRASIGLQDYSRIKLDEGDTNTQEKVFKEFYSKVGLSDDQIKSMIDTAKANGSLYNQSEVFIKKLANDQAKAKEELLIQQKRQQEEQLKEITTFWTGVEQTIKKSSNLAGIPIPETEKNEFFQYVKNPVKDGKSQRDIDSEGMTVEEALAFDYLVYKTKQKKVNLTKLFSKLGETQRVRNLREGLSGTPRTSGSSSQSNRGNSRGSSVDFDAL